MVTASLKALLSNLIDYAGLYPPAGLPLATVLENYARRYLASPYGWMLNRLVLPAAHLSQVQLGGSWRVTLLVDGEPGPLPAQVETLETKVAHKLSLPTYCEAPPDQISGGAFAKVRTGGLTPEAIPHSNQVADFLHAAAARRLPFKATAGLHHPLRCLRPLTYAADSPRAFMHGFINVFLAAALAWHGEERGVLIDLLHEVDVLAFEFSDAQVKWHGRSITTAQIESTRREFAHSFGSCSFEEPVADLQQLGLLR